MKKETLVLLGLIAVAGLALFFDDVAAWLGGMTPLEAVKQIATFILHVTVGTVAATALFGLPKIVKPWMRMLKRRQRRAWRSGPDAQWQTRTPSVRMPKLTATLTLPQPPAARPMAEQSNAEPPVRLDW